jgi:hypothetical protein
MVLVGTLEKATTLATSARRDFAAASTVTVVALQITAPLQRAAKRPSVLVHLRCLSSDLP